MGPEYLHQPGYRPHRNDPPLNKGIRKGVRRILRMSQKKSQNTQAGVWGEAPVPILNRAEPTPIGAGQAPGNQARAVAFANTRTFDPAPCEALISACN